MLTESPTKRTTRSSTASPPSPTQSVAPRSTTSAAQTNSSSSTSRASKRNAAGSVGGWIHTPSNLTLIWLAVSLPLVIWDTGYVLLRPHSMPGGWLHKPIWSPYALYGTIDYVYGFPAYEAGDGWTAAQGWFNALETAAYLVYLWLVYSHGTPAAVPGRGAPDPDTVDAVGAPGVFKRLSESRVLHGRIAAIAVLIGYSTALVTFVKTVLYCKYFSVEIFYYICIGALWKRAVLT